MKGALFTYQYKYQQNFKTANFKAKFAVFYFKNMIIKIIINFYMRKNNIMRKTHVRIQNS